MLKRVCLTASLVLVASSTLIARDGTLPIILEGKSFSVPRNQQPDLSTHIRFNDQETSHGTAVPCSLRGSQIAAEGAAGDVAVGGERFEIIGTCKDANSNFYEVVARSERELLHLVGKVNTPSSNATEFNGIATLKNAGTAKKLKFELK